MWYCATCKEDVTIFINRIQLDGKVFCNLQCSVEYIRAKEDIKEKL